MVNRSATWADWDEELLAIELLDLQTSGFDLALTGFDTKQIDDLILSDTPVEDTVPPLPDHPVTCAGDLWLCGSHRVLCGDATDAETVSRLLGEHKPFLMVTDPVWSEISIHRLVNPPPTRFRSDNIRPQAQNIDRLYA